MINLYDGLTDDFVETFSTKEECKGAMARTIAMTGELPEGVNANDLRVQQIIKWCKENLHTN